MRAPADRDASATVIQIDITNRCDILKCSNCTRMLTHQPNRVDMTYDNFRRAVDSLVDFDPHGKGVVGVFGGNPCAHPDFERFAEYIEQAISQKRRRGLWTDNFLGHDKTAVRVFGYMNLNVHTDKKAADAMKAAGAPFEIHGQHHRSFHSPILVAIKDMIGKPGGPKDEADMWKMIEGCDIGNHWSACIIQKGEDIKAYFCEVAAAFELVYPDINTGIDVTPGWWKLGVESFRHQEAQWCTKCGVPLRLRGHEDLDFTDDFSKTHQPMVELTIGSRKAVLHDDASGDHTHQATDYILHRERK